MPSCCCRPGPVLGASSSCEPQAGLGSLLCARGSCGSQGLGGPPRTLEAVGLDFKARPLEAQSLCSVNDTMLGPLPRGRGGPCDTPTPTEAWILPLSRAAGLIPAPLPFPPPSDSGGRSPPRPTRCHHGSSRLPLPSFSSSYLVQEAQGQDGRGDSGLEE